MCSYSDNLGWHYRANCPLGGCPRCRSFSDDLPNADERCSADAGPVQTMIPKISIPNNPRRFLSEDERRRVADNEVNMILRYFNDRENKDNPTGIPSMPLCGFTYPAPGRLVSQVQIHPKRHPAFIRPLEEESLHILAVCIENVVNKLLHASLVITKRSEIFDETGGKVIIVLFECLSSENEMASHFPELARVKKVTARYNIGDALEYMPFREEVVSFLALNRYRGSD